MDDKKRASLKRIGLWLLLVTTFVAAYQIAGTPTDSAQPFDRLSEDLASGSVESIEVRLSGTTGVARVQLREEGSSEATVYETRPMPVREFLELDAFGAPVSFDSPERIQPLSVTLSWAPVLLVALFFVFFIRALNKSQKSGPRLDEMMNPRFEPVRAEPGSSPVRGLAEARAGLLAAMEAVN